MSQAHLTAFLADLRAINRRINVNDFFGTRTSLSGLITRLQNTVNNPTPLSVFDALRLCANPADARIDKYTSALQRLTSVWGRGAHRRYPDAHGFVFGTDLLRARARANFANDSVRVPPGIRPAYNVLETHDDNPFLFNHGLGPGYFQRLNVHGNNLDITGRSLLLKAGFGAPVSTGTDNGYIASLQLGQAEIDAMNRGSILDVGCGAAIFRAEMETLYGCITTGIDFNYNHIPGAIAEGQRRYARATLYLKMLSDMGVLGRSSTPLWTGPLIGILVNNIAGILAAYANNPPRNGDVFDLAAAMNAYRPQRWGFCISMFLLCYFNAEQQTDAVLNMCLATRRAVFLHSGQGAVLTPRLDYDQAQIRHAYPGCNIVVKDARTHHIYLQ